MRKLCLAAVGLGLLLLGVLAWFTLERAPRFESAHAEAATPPVQPRSADEPLDVAAPDAVVARAPVTAEPLVVAGASTRTRSTFDAHLLVSVRTAESGESLADIWLGVSLEKRSSDRTLRDFTGQTTSGSAGTARIGVPAGVGLQLSAHDPEQRAAPQRGIDIEPLVAGEERAFELRMVTEPDVGFAGRVVADESGAALPHARVWMGDVLDLIELDGWDGVRWLPSNRQRTSLGRASRAQPIVVGRDARFDLRAASWKNSCLFVEAEGFGGVLLPVAERTGEFEIRLARPAAVDVLLSAAERSAVEGVELRFSIPGNRLLPAANTLHSQFLGGSLRWEATSDEDGTCRIEGLPSGVPLTVEYQVGDDLPQFLPQPLVLLPRENRLLALEIGGGATVSGWVRDARGVAAPDVELWLAPGPPPTAPHSSRQSGESVRIERSNANGVFRFAGVPDGDWSVGLCTHRSFAAGATRLKVLGGRDPAPVELVASNDLFLRGRVLDPRGQPQQAHVLVHAEDGSHVSRAVSTPWGDFKVGPLVPGGYLLVAESSGSGNVPLAASPSLRAEAGASELLLTLRESGSLAGRVHDEVSGRAVEAQVWISGPALGAEWGRQDLSDTDGAFTFTGLPEGSYSLSAATLDGRFGRLGEVAVSVNEQRADLVLGVRAAQSLRVTYTGPVEIVLLRVHAGGTLVAATAAQRDRPITLVVPAGELQVDCSDGPYGLQAVRSRSVQVRAGVVAEVVFGPDD